MDHQLTGPDSTSTNPASASGGSRGSSSRAPSARAAQEGALRTGVGAGLLAYLLWGLFPLYFVLLDGVDPFDIAANRVVWSFVLVIALVVVLRRGAVLRGLVRDRRTLLGSALAGIALTTNWTIYLIAVDQDRVVEGALGYYINPLVTVLFGVVLLHERLSRLQWSAVGLAAVAVAVLTLEEGRPPWFAFGLAISFACYGLAKKLVDAPALEGLTLETGTMLVPAAALLAFLYATDQAALFTSSLRIDLLMVGLGVLTTVPLLLFGAATGRVPLSLLGLLQYVTPTVQFLVGVVVLSEPMPVERIAGFVLVWCALAVLAFDGIRRSRSQGAENLAG